MCGRYDIIEADDRLARYFNIDIKPSTYRPRYNAAPGQKLPVITTEHPHELTLMEWGILPPWSKPDKRERAIINATSEKVATSRVFRDSFAHRRCLVPATGFFEWHATPEGKVPFRFRLKNHEPFAFAGIELDGKSQRGEDTTAFVILTTEPNRIVAPVHNRMPVMLHRDDFDRWLSGDELPDTQQLLAPYPAGELEAYPVSRLVNTATNDTPAIIQPVKP